DDPDTEPNGKAGDDGNRDGGLIDHEGSRRGTGERRVRSDGEVEVTDDHDDRLSGRNDRQNRYLHQNVADISEAEECIWPHDAEEGDEAEERNERPALPHELGHGGAFNRWRFRARG